MKNNTAEISEFAVLAQLNEGFDLVLDALGRFQQLGLVQMQPKLILGLRLTVEEVRAWSNFEFTSAIRDRTGEEWARAGKLKINWQD